MEPDPVERGLTSRTVTGHAVLDAISRSFTWGCSSCQTVQALTELLEVDGRIQIVARAYDGREGVALAEALRPDVVLMDIQLPVMDGIEATRELRRRHPLLPVVAITGSEYQERALEARQAGAVDYVRKGRLGPNLTEVILAAADRASSARMSLRDRER